MFDNVIPHRALFFQVLSAHADRVVAGANATLRLITGLGNAPEAPDALIDEVNLNETSADELKTEDAPLAARFTRRCRGRRRSRSWWRSRPFVTKS